MHSVHSCVKNHNGIPTLFISGQAVPAVAYICYLEDRARYKDFALAGYRLFSFPAYFAGRGINVSSGIGPFRKGIFDQGETPDFSVFDADVSRILQARPDAWIFPRVCLTMPVWWEKRYPEELNHTEKGEACRESMSSLQWRHDAAEMLRALVKHVEESPYAKNIVGYQLAAGTTEEWRHFHDVAGGRGPAAQRGFARYMKEKHGIGDACIPPVEEAYKNAGNAIITGSPELFCFFAYTSHIIAESIGYFCGKIKEFTAGRLITGAFYGYNTLLTDPRFGHLALGEVLKRPEVDFLCGPNSYNTGRALGADWPCMATQDSVRQAGKLWMNECDTRTHLTEPLKTARPEIAPPGFYEGGVWKGPEREDWALGQLRRCFGRSLVTGAGLWWFDMWGGWFASEKIMGEMARYLAVAEQDLHKTNRRPLNQVAVVADEQSLRYLNHATSVCQNWVTYYVETLPKGGVGYDVYDLRAGEELPLQGYKLLIFAGCCENSKALSRTVARARAAGVHVCFSYLTGCVTEGGGLSPAPGEVVGLPLQLDFGAENGGLSPRVLLPEGVSANLAKGYVKVAVGNSYTYYCPNAAIGLESLRALLAEAGVHRYVNNGDIVYAGRNYLCLHAAGESAERTVRLPAYARVARLLEQDDWFIEGNTFQLTMAPYETALFELEYFPMQ